MQPHGLQRDGVLGVGTGRQGQGDGGLGSLRACWFRAEQEQVGRDLNNKFGLSGGFHLFCFKFLPVSACRACQRPQAAVHREAAHVALSGCCQFDTKTYSA